jgi:homoserine kinase
VVEPYRKQLIPHFDDLRESALKNGALGCGISGSGPSVFSLCHGRETAENVARAIKTLFSKTDIPFEMYLSRINTEGIKVIG